MESGKKHKMYQLWVWYHLQDGNALQNGYTLVCDTDNLEELFQAVLKLKPEDERVITQQIDLRVQAI